MKIHLITLILAAALATLLQVTSAAAEANNTRRPTWIERLFGAEDPSKFEALEGVEASEDKKVDPAEEEARAAKAKKSPPKRSAGFSEEEREILESWRNGNAQWKQSSKPLPPGLKKKMERGGELPPGWKKKLEIGAVVDPEVYARAESLPEEIRRRLPNGETGTETIKVGDEIIRVIENSREIVDILEGRRVEGGSRED